MVELDKLFNPTSIAVIGASSKANTVGMKLFHNLLSGQYKGSLYAVNPKYQEIQGKVSYRSIKDIPQSVDLALITTPAKIVPQIMVECGEKGVRNALIISAGFSEVGTEGKELELTVLNLAHQYRIRLIGPNCLGMMRPHLNINATFDNNTAQEGNVALVSQSGALCAAMLDWATSKKIGFSAVVSIGNAVDLDFGEIIDYLAQDPYTKSIVLYIEGIHDAYRFMSGLRAGAKIKPIIVIKAGRFSQGQRAAHSHTGALVGLDDAFDAALRRAGVVRVMSIEALFCAVQVLSSNYHTKGNRLAIITNGGGAGVMAADRASELNIVLPRLSEYSIKQLNQVLPKAWSHQNPVDIIGDATPDRYHSALEICAKDENMDAILVLLTPVAMSDPLKVAKQIIIDAKKCELPIFTCWMGDKHVKTSRKLFAKHKIPCFNTPEEAIEAFSYLADYHHNQQFLKQELVEPLRQSTPDIESARLIIHSALEIRRNMLTLAESKAILKAFDIPITQTIAVASASDAIKAAKTLGFPVAMKINSPDITHKQDVGGVELNIESPEELQSLFNQMINNAKKCKPDAEILGVTIEKMINHRHYRELMIGVIRDNVFGPVMTFGIGGSLVEVLHEREVELPPLNHVLARHLITRGKVAKLLGNFRNMPPVNMEMLIDILLRVSQMICILPEILELDINPLLIDENGAIAVDARMRIAPVGEPVIPYAHLAIRPARDDLE